MLRGFVFFGQKKSDQGANLGKSDKSLRGRRGEVLKDKTKKTKAHYSQSPSRSCKKPRLKNEGASQRDYQEKTRGLSLFDFGSTLTMGKKRWWKTTQKWPNFPKTSPCGSRKTEKKEST